MMCSFLSFQTALDFNYIDFFISNFVVTDNKAPFNHELDYNLEVGIEASPATFSEGTNLTYILDFYFSVSGNLSDSTNLHVARFNGNGGAVFNASTGHKVNVTGNAVARFCAYRDIYIITHVYSDNQWVIDPESVRDTNVLPVYLSCHGGKILFSFCRFAAQNPSFVSHTIPYQECYLSFDKVLLTGV